MLHILNQRFDAPCAARMLHVVGESDDVVLIEQAVQAGLAPGWSGFSRCGKRIHLLQEDLSALGLLDIARRHELSIIDMSEFLTLTERHEQSVTWY
ncbi:DsrH/TusB family sulfur relay protein [Halomonas sp. HNIBRBA4712]|uniref:DsrH/TusB family sulfur relay protein n=1 Tax=Halomonas sp. HNIBRBA4712 TaxID=3373087 RepID=UPI00374574FA